MNTFALPRNLVIFGIAIPLALLLGYMLAEPGDFMHIGVVLIMVMVLSIPIFLKWHYPILIFSWNFPLIVSLLPGQPSMWILMSLASFGLTVLAYVMDKNSGFQNVPSITWALLFLILVAAVTAKVTGGLGLHSLGGSQYGGKKFFYLIMAILGYFAISSHRIPEEKVTRYTRFYFLSGSFSVVSNLAFMAGPLFWWLFWFFPVDSALDQAREEFMGPAVEAKFVRLTGLGFASLAVVCYMFARHGLAGIFDVRRWWRLPIFLLVAGLSTLSGFRGTVVILGMTFVLQFFFEGLFRTRLLLVFVLMGVMGTAVVVPFASKMPLSVQRSLSFLPIEIDPVATAHAQASLEWRQDMWRMVIPQIPKYFWIGKGYALDPTDLWLTEMAVLRGLAKNNEYSAKVGDYHNGPLSVIIPLGIFGVIGFLWFWTASLLWLYRRYRDGPDYLKRLNTFLLSYFIARVIFFLFGFGSFWSDLPMFVGMIGLSVALNGTRPRSSVVEENVALNGVKPELARP